MWIDSHCHLDFPDFAEEGVAALVDRARLNRVGGMLTISTHTARIDRYTALADAFPNVWTTIGVHPHQAAEAGETDITADRLVQLAASHPKIVAIGECGLDYHYDYAPRDVQKRVFTAHLDAAVAADLPVIIHAREADADMAAMLAPYAGRVRGVMHCFSSGAELARTALGMGLYVSFSGIVTFPKSTDLQEICAATPLEKILVETDAPYLAPVPYRGKRNEPSFVSHTGRYIAKLHQKNEDEVMHQTTQNFFSLFNKIKR